MRQTPRAALTYDPLGSSATRPLPLRGPGRFRLQLRDLAHHLFYPLASARSRNISVKKRTLACASQ